MGIVIAGASLDVSFLIDFLPSYLFPNEERTISQWLISGISLGGHSTWIILKDGKNAPTPTLPCKSRPHTHTGTRRAEDPLGHPNHRSVLNKHPPHLC